MPASKQIQRFNYRRIRQTRATNGPIAEKEARPKAGEPVTSLALAETMIAAARRRFANDNEINFLKKEDIRIQHQTGGPPLEVCLLVDTSGSMNGKRIREVKTLADHLVRQMHEPLSLVTFQEGDVSVKVRSTRNTHRVRYGLAAMSAAGLTPLGEGIRLAASYLSKRRGKKHLLILITDGLPTWSIGDKDPYQDAIEAGETVKKAGINFICIGLEPQRTFLEKMAEKADASLYIVDDLDHKEIAAITRREKSRVKLNEN
ncbi:MAG: VWA domain-containing protein [Clostridiales bacterium]|jgi:magnesium chelatase subunit D|nr:VWA domain-containing protein [Clostridiales bacterium]